jgi:hypothetical protein
MFIFPVAHTQAKFYLYREDHNRSTWRVRLSPRLHRAVYAQDLLRLGRQAGEQLMNALARGIFARHNISTPDPRFDKIKEWRN